MTGLRASGLRGSGLRGARSSVRSAVSGYSPLGDATLGLWLDASKASSITHVAGAVSQWSDLSGNARHATNAVGGTQPTTGTVSVNGLNTLSFDGGDSLVGASIATAQNRTVYAVVVANAHDSTRRVIVEGGAGALAYAQMQMELGATNRLTSLTLDSLSTVVTALSTTDFPTAVPVVAIMRRVSGATQAVYEGLTLKDSKAITGDVDSSATGYVIGKQRNAAARFWKGSICEIVDYSAAHTADQRAVVVSYLAAKWGASV